MPIEVSSAQAEYLGIPESECQPTSDETCWAVDRQVMCDALRWLLELPDEVTPASVYRHAVSKGYHDVQAITFEECFDAGLSEPRLPITGTKMFQVPADGEDPIATAIEEGTVAPPEPWLPGSDPLDIL